MARWTLWLPCKHRLAAARRNSVCGEALYKLQNYAGGALSSVHLPYSAVCHDCAIEHHSIPLTEAEARIRAKKY